MARRSFVLVLILALGFGLVACTGEDSPGAGGSTTTPTTTPTTTSTTTTQTPTPTSTQTPQPGLEPWVMYDYLNTTKSDDADSIGVYRRRLTDFKAEKVGVPGERRGYSVSSDGRWVAAIEFTDTTDALFVARSEDLPSMRRIVAPTREEISSVLWGPEGILFYILGPRDRETSQSGMERFYSIRTDGTGRQLIASFPVQGEFTFRTLLAHSRRRNDLVWFNSIREGAGGDQGLFLTNVATGATRTLLPQSRTFESDASAITADAARFFYVRGQTQLVERTVFTGDERVLYRAGSGEPALEHVHVTPSGSFLVFQATQDPLVGGAPPVSRPKTTTYRIRLSDRRRTTVNAETTSGGAHYVSLSLSPDGRYIWFVNQSVGPNGATVLLNADARTRRVVAAWSKNRSAALMGWISISA